MATLVDIRIIWILRWIIRRMPQYIPVMPIMFVNQNKHKIQTNDSSENVYSLLPLPLMLLNSHHSTLSRSGRRRNPIFIPHMIRSHHTLALEEASVMADTDRILTGSSSSFIRLSTQLISLRGWVTQLGILRQISSTRHEFRRGEFCLLEERKVDYF